MSDYTPPPPPPEQPPAGGPPPPPQYGAPTPPQYGAPQPGGYGTPPPAAAGVPRPGELLDRFLARFIDGILFGVVYFILSILFVAILVSDTTFDLSTGTYDTGSRVLYNIVFAVVSTAISLGYFAYMESAFGQTVGKMVMKLKVVGPSGGNPSLVEAAKRNIWLALGLLAILGTIGTILNLVGSIAAVVIIVMGINALPDRRTKFDELAGCQVMKVG